VIWLLPAETRPSSTCDAAMPDLRTRIGPRSRGNAKGTVGNG